jgi:glycosyltransferase involved in cell wall biosynthesis
LPTVLIEALAAGAPVVATDCLSGPREILRNGELGTLVPVGDVEALAEGISHVLRQPPAKVPLQALSAFTMNTSVNRYLELIEGYR